MDCSEEDLRWPRGATYAMIFGYQNTAVSVSTAPLCLFVGIRSIQAVYL